MQWHSDRVTAWRASTAHKQQQCKLHSVHWDSYHDKPRAFGNFIAGSTCWVHVECTYGHPAFPKGVHLGKIKMYDVPKLRRCKEDASQVNTSCQPLTTQDVEAGLANLQQQWASWLSLLSNWYSENDP